MQLPNQCTSNQDMLSCTTREKNFLAQRSAFKKQSVVMSYKGVTILKFKKNIIRAFISIKIISEIGNTVKYFSLTSFLS